VLEFRSYEGANAGLALIRDGNGTRSFETLLRYRGAAMAEFWRALKTLKALQAEQATRLEREAATDLAMPESSMRPAARRSLAHRAEPNEPNDLGRRLEYVQSEPGVRARVMHEPPATWRPNEPEACPSGPAASSPRQA
jgi:hypothetical protein